MVFRFGGLTHPAILEPLCKIQKKVVTTITLSDKYAHSSPLFYMLELLKLRDIHSLNLLCFVYKCRFLTPIVPFKEFFIALVSVHDYGTRKALKGDLFISRINTIQYGKRAAKYTPSILWNNLDSTIKISPSLNVFKKRLKRILLVVLFRLLIVQLLYSTSVLIVLDMTTSQYYFQNIHYFVRLTSSFLLIK